MSDRTQLAIGRNAITVPSLTKRIIECFVSTGVTALIALAILLLNNVLTGRGGWVSGFNIWLDFIQRPDILGTMLLTSLVTAMFLKWQRDGSNTKR